MGIPIRGRRAKGLAGRRGRSWVNKRGQEMGQEEHAK